MEDWKIRVAVLWLIDTGAALIAAVASLFEPNALQQFLATNGLGTIVALATEEILTGVAQANRLNTMPLR